MQDSYLPKKWSGDAQPPTLPLYGVSERRIDYLNLSEGMYEVMLHVQNVVGVVHKTHLTPSKSHQKDGNTGSYVAIMPIDDDSEHDEGFVYLWDTGRFGYSYFGGSQPIAYVRELLPFEKIEMMFQMSSFLNAQRNVFYDIRPEDGVWLSRSIEKCERMWSEG